MTAFRCRISSVKMKRGAEVRVLRHPLEDFQTVVDKKIAEVLSVQRTEGPIAGFAIVVWGANMTTTTESLRSSGSHVHRLLVPDFVRNAVAEHVQEQG